jgi:hypothetical protein
VKNKNKLFPFPIIDLRFLSRSARNPGAIPTDYIHRDVLVCLVSSCLAIKILYALLVSLILTTSLTAHSSFSRDINVYAVA